MVLIYGGSDVSVFGWCAYIGSDQKKKNMMIRRNFSGSCRELYLSDGERNELIEVVIYRFRMHGMVISIWL